MHVHAYDGFVCMCVCACRRLQKNTSAKTRNVADTRLRVHRLPQSFSAVPESAVSTWRRWWSPSKWCTGMGRCRLSTPSKSYPRLWTPQPSGHHNLGQLPGLPSLLHPVMHHRGHKLNTATWMLKARQRCSGLLHSRTPQQVQRADKTTLPSSIWMTKSSMVV